MFTCVIIEIDDTIYRGLLHTPPKSLEPLALPWPRGHRGSQASEDSHPKGPYVPEDPESPPKTISES